MAPTENSFTTVMRVRILLALGTYKRPPNPSHHHSFHLLSHRQERKKERKKETKIPDREPSMHTSAMLPLNVMNPIGVQTTDIDEVRFLSWRDPTLYHRAIGAINVNGGIAVAIITKWCAIVANIPPQPYPTYNSITGIMNLKARMNEMQQMYLHTQPQFFSNCQIEVVILAPHFFENSVLPDHVATIKSELVAIELTPIVVYYVPVPGGRPIRMFPGVLFIDGRQDYTCIYVDGYHYLTL
jgi:hypothetical protein